MCWRCSMTTFPHNWAALRSVAPVVTSQTLVLWRAGVQLICHLKLRVNKEITTWVIKQSTIIRRNKVELNISSLPLFHFLPNVAHVYYSMLLSALQQPLQTYIYRPYALDAEPRFKPPDQQQSLNFRITISPLPDASLHWLWGLWWDSVVVPTSLLRKPLPLTSLGNHCDGSRSSCWEICKCQTQNIYFRLDCQFVGI